MLTVLSNNIFWLIGSFTTACANSSTMPPHTTTTAVPIHKRVVYMHSISPIGVHCQWVTTITAVMILNHAVGLDVFVFVFGSAVTQLARQLHQERTQVVCSNREARKRPARRHSYNGPWTSMLVIRPNPIHRACGFLNCRLTVCHYRFSWCRRTSCQTWVNSLAKTLQYQLQGNPR